MTARRVRVHLPVQELIDRLGVEEQHLKNIGFFARAEGVRDAVVQVLRMADEPEPETPPMEHGGDA